MKTFVICIFCIHYPNKGGYNIPKSAYMDIQRQINIQSELYFYLFLFPLLANNKVLSGQWVRVYFV